MNRNEQYAPFRTPLTEEQKELIRRAEKPEEVYARIAVEEANRQLALLSNTGAVQNALPDVPDICLHYPGVDPRGVYSVIDMKLKFRTQRIYSVLSLREKQVYDLVYGVLNSDVVLKLWMDMKEIARRHRIYVRAEKLCWDEAAADALHIQARKLEVEPVVAQVDLVLQGVEYLLGIRDGIPPAEVDRFYQDTLGVIFTPAMRETAQRLIQPEEAGVLFTDFENVLLQALFSMPENWGLTLEELEALRDEE